MDLAAENLIAHTASYSKKMTIPFCVFADTLEIIKYIAVSTVCHSLFHLIGARAPHPFS